MLSRVRLVADDDDEQKDEADQEGDGDHPTETTCEVALGGGLLLRHCQLPARVCRRARCAWAGLEPREDEAANAKQEGGDAVLDVMVGGAGLVAEEVGEGQ